MGHLLLLENWVEGTGQLFPKRIKELGHTYTFVSRNLDHYHGTHDSRPVHPVIRHADNILTIETNDVPNLVSFLEQQHKLLKFDGVVTICDYYVETAANVADMLNLPQAYSKNVAVARRKHLVRQALDNAGIGNPLFATAANVEEAKRAANDIGFPLVVKPSDLGSSAFVMKVHSEQELENACKPIFANTRNFRDQERIPVVVLEEFLEGPEYSVEACSFGGDISIIGITDKSLTGEPYFIEDGHMFPAKLTPDIERKICSYAKDVLNAIGYDNGITHTEIKLTEKGPRLIEVNPRPAGNFIVELVEHVTGIDLMKVHIELALGRSPSLELQPGAASAAIKFLVPWVSGQLAGLKGRDSLSNDPNIVRFNFDKVDQRVSAAPIDNACYAGHVVTVDRSGLSARQFAEAAIARLELEIVQ